MFLAEKVRGFWISCQRELFPWVEELLGSVEGRYRKLVLALEMVGVERFLPPVQGRRPGRPLKHRATLARAFMAKMVFNIATTTALVERVRSDTTLRCLCGWRRVCDGPSESTFSRAFKEFAEAEWPARLHAALIEEGYSEPLVGHISRDSTAIEARKKPVRQKKEPERLKRKRGRPPKDEQSEAQPKRLERQRTMGVEEMVEELPKQCTVGIKQNAKGYRQKWTGYKLHMEGADRGIPIRCIVSSASLHDRQAAIPLMEITAQRVPHLYELMDSAYEAKQIRKHRAHLRHVPIIDSNPRNGKAELIREKKAQRAAGFVPPEQVRYKERSTVERAFGRLKDEFGGRQVRVRGHEKVAGHLMFGVLALTVDQLMRLLH